MLVFISFVALSLVHFLIFLPSLSLSLLFIFIFGQSMHKGQSRHNAKKNRLCHCHIRTGEGARVYWF